MSLRYKESAIQPGGRLSYGHYLSSGNITNSVVRTSYYGDGTTNEIGGGTGGGQETPETGFYMFLSKEVGEFDARLIATQTGVTDTIQLIGYKANEPAPTYVMDMSRCLVIYDGDSPVGVECPENYGILGIPPILEESGLTGMTVNVVDNGTTGTTIQVSITSAITATAQGASEGELTIPCNIYLSTGSTMSGDTQEDTDIKWYNRSGDCRTIFLKYTWKITGGVASSNYTLDLTNDSAGINAGSDGNVLSGATKPTCQAKLYFGTELLTSGVSYTVATPQAAAVSGLSHTVSNGVCTLNFDSVNFNFLGTSLEITITAMHGVYVTSKIMTVTKNYPGADGTGATTRWIIPSRDEIKYNPNTQVYEPATITARVMVQVNDQEPTEDTSTLIWWDWDKSTLLQHTGNTGVQIDVSVGAPGHSYLALGLKNGSGVFYELETIPVLSDGRDGAGGWQLDLSNEMEYVNATYEGTIVSGQAQYLACTATLYFGAEPYANARYSLSGTYQGISIASGTGVMSFTESYKNNFTGDTCGILVYARDENDVLRGAAKMTLVKNKPGAPGEDATRYWLALSANAVVVDTANTANPSKIYVDAWQQTGGDAPTGATGCSITYGFDTTSPSTSYTSAGITVLTGRTYLTVKLSKDGVQRDIETVPILRNGKDAQGRNGAAVLGPTEWTSAMGRRWHSGNENCAPGHEPPTPEDLLFLDVIVRVENGQRQFYYCNSSYTQTEGQSWTQVSSAWTHSDEQYDFVAANLILADKAKIQFLTGNGLYLMNSGGTITGGAQAATSGDSIVFWAGGDDQHIEEAPFQVDYNGNLYAKSGTFSGFIQMPYSFVSELNSGYTNLTGIGGNSSTVTYYADHRAYLISDSANTTGSGGEIWFASLMLPQPTSEINGMMYEVIVEPASGISGVESLITVVMSGNTYTSKYNRRNNKNFQTLAFSERYEGDNIFLYGGRYQFTCIPHRNSNLTKTYTWALTMANGQFMLDKYRSSSYSDQYLMTPMFSLNETTNIGLPYSADTVNKVVAYSGTKPTVTQNNHMTLYVSRD